MTISSPASPGSQTLAPESSDERFADANETGEKQAFDQDSSQSNKKAKIEVEQPGSFNFTLSISIMPSMLPEFVASVRTRIEEDATKQGGSAKIERAED